MIHKILTLVRHILNEVESISDENLDEFLAEIRRAEIELVEEKRNRMERDCNNVSRLMLVRTDSDD